MFHGAGGYAVEEGCGSVVGSAMTGILPYRGPLTKVSVE